MARMQGKNTGGIYERLNDWLAKNWSASETDGKGSVAQKSSISSAKSLNLRLLALQEIGLLLKASDDQPADAKSV